MVPATVYAQQPQPDYIGSWSTKGVNGCAGAYPFSFVLSQLLPNQHYRGSWKLACANRSGAFVEDGERGPQLTADGALKIFYKMPNGMSGTYLLRRQGNQLIGTLSTNKNHTYNLVFDKTK